MKLTTPFIKQLKMRLGLLKPSALCAIKPLQSRLGPKSVNHSRSMKEGKKGEAERDIQRKQTVESDLVVSGIYKGSRFSLQSSKERCVLFSYFVSFFTWENNPSFEASPFKLIKKTINEGSFHEIVM